MSAAHIHADEIQRWL